MVEQGKRVICLFDMDMTLTPARQVIQQDMVDTLQKVRDKGVHLGVVSGSDLNKVIEQTSMPFINSLEYCFAENGLYTLKKGEFHAKESFKEWIGEEKSKKFINFALHYIADLDIPVKRGTFIEYRNGMINVSPIGRNCSQEEREAFEKYDNEAKVRNNMIEKLKE